MNGTKGGTKVHLESRVWGVERETKQNNKRATSLEDVRKDLVRHLGAILFPVLSVLSAAASIITVDTVDEEDGHIDDVEVRHEVGHSTGEAEGERHHEVTDVVKVTRKTPPSREEEVGLTDGSIGLLELGRDVLSGLAPDVAFALVGTEVVLLSVDGAEDVVSGESESVDSNESGGGEINGVLHEEGRLERVEVGKPDKITVGEVITEVIVGNINGAEVPALVVEKVHNVNVVEDVQSNHRVGNVSNTLVLGSGKREVDDGPSNNSGTSIEEELEVEILADTGVELNSHENVIENRVGKLAILRVGGEETGLDVGNHGQRKTSDGGPNEEGAPMVVDDRGLEETKVRTGAESNDGDDPAVESVHAVREQVASGGELTVVNGTRDEGIEDNLPSEPHNEHLETLCGSGREISPTLLERPGKDSINTGIVPGDKGSTDLTLVRIVYKESKVHKERTSTDHEEGVDGEVPSGIHATAPGRVAFVMSKRAL